MLSWMYLVMAMGCLIFFWDEGVQTIIATSLLLLNSHLTEEVEVDYEDTTD